MKEILEKAFAEIAKKMAEEALKKPSDEHDCDNEECNKSHKLLNEIEKYNLENSHNLIEQILKLEDSPLKNILSTFYVGFHSLREHIMSL